MEKIVQWIEIISKVLGSIAIILAWFQWKETNRLKRADHLQQLGVLLLENKEIQEVLHILIVGSTWYDAKTWSFVSVEMEQKVDRFLAYYSYVCYLRDNGLLGEKEFLIFKYDLAVIGSNPDMQTYLKHLQENAENSKLSEIPFQPILKYLSFQK